PAPAPAPAPGTALGPAVLLADAARAIDAASTPIPLTELGTNNAIAFGSKRRGDPIEVAVGAITVVVASAFDGDVDVDVPESPLEAIGPASSSGIAPISSSTC